MVRESSLKSPILIDCTTFVVSPKYKLFDFFNSFSFCNLHVGWVFDGTYLQLEADSWPVDESLIYRLSPSCRSIVASTKIKRPLFVRAEFGEQKPRRKYQTRKWLSNLFWKFFRRSLQPSFSSKSRLLWFSLIFQAGTLL